MNIYERLTIYPALRTLSQSEQDIVPSSKTFMCLQKEVYIFQGNCEIMGYPKCYKNVFCIMRASEIDLVWKIGEGSLRK